VNGIANDRLPRAALLCAHRQLPYGTPVLLDASEQSPFAMFGEIPAGTTLPVLFNNLFRAPVFAQPPPSDTFLMVMYGDREPNTRVDS